MATLLYRLGRFSTRRAIPVIIAWLLLAAGVLVGGFALGGQMQDSFSIPGTESQTAIDRLDAVFPQAGGGTAEIVIDDPHGASLAAGGRRAHRRRGDRARQGRRRRAGALALLSVRDGCRELRRIDRDHRGAVHEGVGERQRCDDRRGAGGPPTP